jgi:biopolymer transport protein ExbD
MAVKIKSTGAIGAVPLAPMIDVVFQLLIFFLVATQFAEEDRQMDVPLPEASEAMPLTVAPQAIFVNIDQQGHLFLGIKPVDEVELEAELRRATVNNPVRQSVIIRADKRVPLQHPVTVMNICKKVGIPDFSLDIKGEKD